MKIAIVVQRLSGGGAERVASIIANYLYSKGHSVTIILAYYATIEYNIDKGIKIEVIKSNRRTSFGRLIDRNRKIFQAVKNSNSEVILSFITNEVIYSAIRGIPVIQTLRNDPNNKENGIIAARLRVFSYRISKHIVFQTEGARDYFPKDIQEKGSIIPNPIETIKMPQWNGCDSNTIMTACRLTKQKNIPLLIDAFDKLHDEFKQYKLKIFGEGELHDYLERYINNRNSKMQIELCGHSKNIYDEMSKSYMFVLSSDYEGVSNSMLEALVIGLPCVCTDCPPGGAKMFIENNVNGKLVNVGDCNGLYNAMREMIVNKNAACVMSEKARSIKNRVDVVVVAKQWEEIIRNNCR